MPFENPTSQRTATKLGALMKIKFDRIIRLNTDTEFVPDISTAILHPEVGQYLTETEKYDMIPQLNSLKYTKEFTTFKGSLPLTIQIRSDSLPLGTGEIYSHPNTLEYVKRIYPPFKRPMACFDYLERLGYYFVESPVFSASKKVSIPKILIQHYIMYSEKDVVFSFLDYQNTGIPQFPNISTLLTSALKRQRCLRTHIEFTGSKHLNIQQQIKTSWGIQDVDGVIYQVYISFVDICALAVGGLGKIATTYLGKMDFKDNLTKNDKENLIASNKLGTVDYDQYALGDLCLTDIFDSSIILENRLREQLGLPLIVSEEKRLTVGAMTARILRDYIKLKVGKQEIQLNDYSVFCSSKSQQDYLRQFRKKPQVEKLVYLSMVDGGRCVRELALHPVMKGDLDDIDIDGCYGNGLKNQDYALGNPVIDPDTYTLGDFLKKYEKQLVPGLWTARLFGSLQTDKKHQQDLLISKTKEGGRRYSKRLEDAVDDTDDLESALESSMVLLTDELYAALINHDFLEVIKNYTANDEKHNWLTNIQVTGFSGYLKSHETFDFNEMIQGYAEQKIIPNKKSASIISTAWYRIPMREYATKLLEIRSQSAKKSPMNEFLKLIINATYGCIASQYFDTDDTGISNTIVANNITARARCLGWTMAKALRCAMVITDGGVFDTRKVLYLTGNTKKPTINSLFKVTFDIYTKDSRNSIYELKPLCSKLSDLSDLKTVSDVQNWLLTVDSEAWNHCSNTFPELTIFKQKQYSFESKHPFTELILHNKADYIMTNEYFTYTPPNKAENFPGKLDKTPYILHKQRGTKGEEAFRVSRELYQAIKDEKPISVTFKQSSLIGLTEYQQIMRRLGEPYRDEDGFELQDMAFDTQRFIELGITAGDMRIQQRRIYSHIPTAMKHPDYATYEKTVKITEEMRKTVNPILGLQRLRQMGWR